MRPQKLVGVLSLVELVPTEIARYEPICQPREKIASEAAQKDVHDIYRRVLDYITQEAPRRIMEGEDAAVSHSGLQASDRARLGLNRAELGHQVPWQTQP